jgi:hypothetical protein
MALSPRESKAQARALARLRTDWTKERAQAELGRLRGELKAAQARRRRALVQASASCRKARLAMRQRVKAYRAGELSRIAAEARAMATAARNQCQARQHRIRGSRIVDKTAAALREESRLQRQLARLERRARLAHTKTTARERAQEDDDAVRSNLPAELVPVFERVKRQIRGGQRTTRTEAFLEWAESHPEDVLAYQQHETDREVRRLIAEHEAAERSMRKTKGTRRRKRAMGDDLSEVPF